MSPGPEESGGIPSAGKRRRATEGRRTAGPVGRVLRLLTGIALLALTIPALVEAPPTTGTILRIAGWLTALVLIYLGIHLAVGRWALSLNPWAGAALALLPAVGLWATGGVRALAVLLFIGVSLVVASLRSDGGCEVMSVPAVLTGHHTHLVCLVFSPIDRVETRLRKRA